uniref:Uncharacterized protein n=4 Tax=Glossina TaxID=7393 RepID=A0A1A9ZDW4_GLOPL
MNMYECTVINVLLLKECRCLVMAVFEQHSHVSVWWFPREFCQSRFGEYRESGTNSCTLISLILADKIAKEQIFSQKAKTLPQRAVEVFGDAMNEGNTVYSRVFESKDDNGRRRRAPNLNIPEAIAALANSDFIEFQLQEWFYTHLTASPTKETYHRSVASRIAQVLKLGVQLFRQPSSNTRAKNLFAALIADSRTTIFIFEFPINIISFFDSHQHGRQSGAVVAQCSIDHLEDLCSWFVRMLDDVYKSRPSVYEISFLTTSADAPNVIPADQIH